MNDIVIVTVYVITDDVLRASGHRDHVLVEVSDAEVLTIAVVASMYFHNNHERTLFVLKGMGYITGSLSISRFNRRLHRLGACLESILTIVGEVFARGEVFIMDSFPVPVCRRVRAWRCRKVRGREYCGYCAAKKEKFFGWRLHLLCTADGLPVAFELLPASYHDLTPIHELTSLLPEGATIYGDKAYNSADDEDSILRETGVRIVPARRKNMALQNSLADDNALRQYRHSIETLNSQLESMGVQHLHARTNPGLELKLLASLIALACLNMY